MVVVLHLILVKAFLANGRYIGLVIGTTTTTRLDEVINKSDPVEIVVKTTITDSCVVYDKSD